MGYNGGMSADADKAQAEPRTVGTVKEFTEWAEDLYGQSLLYRGLANADWGVESAAYRRIKKMGEAKLIFEEIPGVFKNYISLLLEKASLRDFRTHEGNELSDLKLLARLQHYGAATCLIDFTQNPLVALWFACQEQLEGSEVQDGKVVVMETGVDVIISGLHASAYRPSAFRKVGSQELALKKGEIEKLLYDKMDLVYETMWKWEPTPRESRVIAQQSVFVFGPAMIEDHYYKEVRIPASAKEGILHALDKKFGINEASLFGDFAGFALANAHDKPYEEYSADDYYQFAESFFQIDEHEKSIQYCRKAIAKEPQHIEAHFLRGRCNVALEKWKESIKDFSWVIEVDPTHARALSFRGMAYEDGLQDLAKAVADYTAEIKFLSTSEGKKSTLQVIQLMRAYIRRGQAQAIMGKHEKAIADFTSVIEIVPGGSTAYLERAKSHRALGNESAAQADEREYESIIQKHPPT